MELIDEIIKILKASKGKIINLSDKNKDCLKNYLFEALYNNESLDEINSLIADENSKFYINNLIKNIKEDGAFVIKKINEAQPKLLIDAFSNIIVINKIKDVESRFSKILKNNELNKLANKLNDISNFCITNNLSGNEYSNILSETYNVSKDISLKIGELYDQNRMELKLNYIIRKITNK